jgi:hypothetical protein
MAQGKGIFLACCIVLLKHAVQSSTTGENSTLSIRLPPSFRPEKPGTHGALEVSNRLALQRLNQCMPQA